MVLSQKEICDSSVDLLKVHNVNVLDSNGYPGLIENDFQLNTQKTIVGLNITVLKYNLYYIHYINWRNNYHVLHSKRTKDEKK